MFRRDILRKFGGIITSIAIITFSGCTQRQQNENNSMDQMGQNNTNKEESMEGQNGEIQESMGSIKENTVSELEFVSWESHKETESKNLQVTVTIKNIGDKTTDIFHYNYDLKLYDSNNEDITDLSASKSGTGGTTIEPGQKGQLVISARVSGSLDDIERYELFLNCNEGPFVDGVYCNK